MKRWKLWTAVASGALCVVSGTTAFFVWDSEPVEDTEIAAGDLAETLPHALPPEPLRDTMGEPPVTQFATPASFNEPAAPVDSPIVRGNNDRFPVRPTVGAAPASFNAQDDVPVDPTASATADEPSVAPVYPSPTYRGGYSDNPPQAITATPADDVPLKPTAGLRSTFSDSSQPEVESSQFASPPEVDPAPAAIVASADEGPVDPTSNDPSAAAGPAAAGPAAAGPAAAEAIVESPPVDPSGAEGAPATLSVTEQTAPVPGAIVDSSEEMGQVPSAPPATIQPGRFGNSPRPLAPALRSTSPSTLSSRSLEAPPAAMPSEPLPAAGPGSFAPQPNNLISNSPGERKFEGVQSPSLAVERSAPEEIQIGKPAKFTIIVRNVGQVAAQDVVVTDQVPQGTRFISANPTAAPSADGVLGWQLGTLKPGDDAVINVELMPEEEGEIGSVAAVTFRTPAAVRTIATRPLLKIEHAGPNKVLIGDDVPFQITVTNPGSGIATDVVVEVDVPDGLAHDGGREIMSDRFDLRPNESRKIDLVVRAMSAGVVQNVVRAVGSGTLSAEHRTQLEIVAPQLQVGAVGPTRRFLDRPVKYQIVVANPGTAPAHDIQLVAHLPRGLKFTAADKKGQYDSRQHAVVWSLEELPEGEQGIVELTAIPTDTGEQKLHIEATADLGLEHQHDHTTVVEDITDLLFTVTDENVPIEIGSETTYQIRVANNGTKVARNVRLAIQVPKGLEITDADGPTQAEQQGDQVVMQPLAQLNQNEEAVYRITAKGTQAGDQILRVQLLSDEFSTPVTKEEITKVYSDK